MGEKTIHGELTLQIPETFRELSLGEMEKMYGSGDTTRWGAWDEKQHVILAVFWKENTGLGGLFARAADPKSVAEGLEKKMRHVQKAYGYELKGFMPGEIAGKPAYGFRYTYHVGEFLQAGETISFLQGKTCYTLYYYARMDEQEAQRHKVFEEVQASAVLES